MTSRNLAVLLLLLSAPAFADKTVTYLSAPAKVSTFSCEDKSGTWVCDVCGSTTDNGGGKAPVLFPCVTCQSATFSALAATCLAAWKTANGL